MLKTAKTVQISGQSIITVDNVEQVVVYMNATVPENGATSISKNIQNKVLYDANKETCRKDMNDFEDNVLTMGGNE